MGAPSELLLHLPVEVARELTAFIDTDDLDQLASVCRASSHSHVFHPPSRKSLILPPTDRERASRLLTSILGRDPTRFTGLAWVQIACPWHVELLLETGAGEFVQSVRVVPEIDRSTEAVDAICENLRALPSLTKLDLSDTCIRDVSIVSEMMQLRVLRMNRTDVSDVAPLSTLVNLEELELTSTVVVDMSCIENMTELRRLSITHRRVERVEFPSFHALSNLRVLHVESISVRSATDFGASLSNLKQLTVRSIRPVDWVENSNPNWRLAEIGVYRLAGYLTQLEGIELDDDAVSAKALSRIPSLRSIHFKIVGCVDALGKLTHLEQLAIWVYSASDMVTDYRVLLTMPSLKRITVGVCGFRVGPLATPPMKQILDVLVLMPQLQSLELEAQVEEANIEGLSRLHQLNHLSLSICPGIKSLEWIKPLGRSLRSLSIRVNTNDTDISALGSLTRLQELELANVSPGRCSQEDFPFLQQLRNLNSLSVDGTIRDLAALCGLTKLKELTIHSKSVHPMRNVHVLGGLTALQKLDISQTRITNLSPLMRLTKLRCVAISSNADCRMLSRGQHPSLLRVLHPLENCLWSCSYGTILEEEEIP